MDLGTASAGERPIFARRAPHYHGFAGGHGRDERPDVALENLPGRAQLGGEIDRMGSDFSCVWTSARPSIRQEYNRG